MVVGLEAWRETGRQQLIWLRQLSDHPRRNFMSRMVEIELERVDEAPRRLKVVKRERGKA
jgi:hypothetical protein